MAQYCNPRNLPWMRPYGGSVEGVCDIHGGPVWIGPQQQQAIKRGMADLVLCHFCAAIMFRLDDVSFMPLSDAHTTVEGE